MIYEKPGCEFPGFSIMCMCAIGLFFRCLHFGFFGRSGHHVRKFKSVVFLAVDHFQHESEKESCHAETGKHHERPCIVEIVGIRHSGIGLVEDLADKQGEEP